MMMMSISEKELLRAQAIESVRYTAGRIGGNKHLRQHCAPGNDG